MARIYEVVCKNCGARWDWCKYDAPDDKCPECGIQLTTNGYDWDGNKVIVFGVGSTSLDIEEAIKKIKGEKAILKGGKSGGE